MSIDKFWEIVCDECSCAIDYHCNCSKSQAIKYIKEDGGIVTGGKHFCNEDCHKKYRDRNK